MFTAKKSSLFAKTDKTSVSTMNVSTQPFIRESMKKSVETKSGNLAKKYATSGSDFVDQFANASKFRTPRSFEDVSRDMTILWQRNNLLALAFLFYLRTITRVVQLFDGSKTKNPQRGQGLKHEGIFRYIWVAVNYPDTFWKNIHLFISVGSWKDIITMLSYDLQYNGWSGRKLNWNYFGQLLLAGLENPNTTHLVRKYLPQIRTNSSCKTLEAQADNIIAKWLCSILFGEKTLTGSTYKKYRMLKSSGTAHEWQQLISRGQFFAIDFDTIHGRALSLLVSGKFLKNHGLETKYEAWISSKPVAKFTGYVYELIQGIPSLKSLQSYRIKTIDAQFNQLVEVAKKGLSSQGIRPISVLDCSGSMDSCMYLGGGKVGKLRSIEVAVSSAIFFNEMIDKRSPFKDYYLRFSGLTEMSKFTGKTFTEKYFTSPRVGYGGTDFRSVFTFLADFRKKYPTISEDMIPNFIICFSDGEFNSVNRNGNLVTNVQAGRLILAEAGFSKEYCQNFGICFIDLPNNFYRRGDTKPRFETFADEKNTFYFSGYDLSPLAFLFGVEGKTMDSIPKTADELFLAAMDQEIFNMLEL